MNNKVLNIELFAFFYAILPTLLLIGSGFLWILGFSLNSLLFPFCTIISYALSLRITNSRACTKDILIIISMFAAFFLLSYFISDYSWDGNYYHQPTIAALSEGWNPIYQHHLDSNGDNFDNIWTDHYAKGQETICATIVSTFQYIELGKMANYFLPFSGFFFSLLVICRRFKGMKTYKKIIISFILAFPPIFWNQVFTFYIDFILYPIVIIALSSVFLYENYKLRFCTILICVVSTAISVKFNFIIWIGLLYLGIIIYLLTKKHLGMAKTVIVAGVSVSIISLISFSYNPFITNTIHHNTPFYPIFGTESGKNIDIMTHVEPEGFKGLSKIEKVFIADLSRPSYIAENIAHGYILRKGNLFHSGQYDVRLGGAGLFWIDSLFLAILVFILSKSFRKKEGLACLLLSIIFLLTQLIVPGGWFYRYVSYIYLIPILFLVVSEWNINEKIVFLRNISYSLLLLNCIVALTCTLGISILNNQVEDYYIKCINASDKPCYKSKLFGFVRKIDQNKRCLIVKDEDIENIPFLSTQSIIGIKYENLNRNVETTWLQDILIKKGIIK